MKIVICGAVGSGKTTLAHHIASEYSYTYVADWDIFKNHSIKTSKDISFATKVMHSNLLLDSINNMQGEVVLDSEFSVAPSVAKEYKDIVVIYLGFVSVKEDILLDLFDKKDSKNKYNISNIKDIKNLSKTFYKECNKYAMQFFDINKEKSLVQRDILDYLNL